VGVLASLYLGYLFLRFVWESFLRPAKNPARWGSQVGAWALITGGAGGIGRGFAHELAKKGFSILLIDRNSEGLEDAATEIRTKFAGRVVQTLTCDFSRPKREWIESVRASLADKDIGMLVNNVGCNTKLPDPLQNQPEDEVDAMLSVNVESTVAMTRLVLPEMIRQKRGGIVMLSSYTGSYPCPNMSVYAGTKAFIDTFATALSEEVRGHGIDVLAIRPFYVVSNMSGFRKPSLTVRSQGGMARDALRCLGHTPRAQPYVIHRLIEFVFSLMPLSLMLRMTHGWMISTRARIIASQERYAKKMKEKADTPAK